jgi:hypothetical protein
MRTSARGPAGHTLPGASDQDHQGATVSTPTVTERIVTLEPTTRDDFADSPGTAIIPITRPAYRFIPEALREPTR